MECMWWDEKNFRNALKKIVCLFFFLVILDFSCRWSIVISGPSYMESHIYQGHGHSSCSDLFVCCGAACYFTGQLVMLMYFVLAYLYLTCHQLLMLLTVFVDETCELLLLLFKWLEQKKLGNFLQNYHCFQHILGKRTLSLNKVTEMLLDLLWADLFSVQGGWCTYFDSASRKRLIFLPHVWPWSCHGPNSTCLIQFNQSNSNRTC